MLLNRMLHLAEGKVRLRIEHAFPERVLNLMSANALPFWEVTWHSPVEFSCTVSRASYRALRRLTEQLGCSVTVEKKAGMPFFVGRFRRRTVLVLSLACACVALFFASFFIWDFSIEGNVPVSDEEILRVLAKNGVGLGAYGLGVDSESLRNHALLELRELSWIAVNVRGFRAHVQVRPRIPTPKLVDTATPVDIVAAKDGLVRKVEALGGEAVVLPGSTVKQGDLLISGVADRGGRSVLLLSALGRVYARTWYTLSAEIPLTRTEKMPTGEKSTAISLVFGDRRIKIWGKGSIPGADYDKITKKTKWTLFGILPLPVTTVREERTFYEPTARERSREEASALGEALLRAYLDTCLADGGTVTAAACTAKERDGRLTVTLRAECEEQIGQSREIPLP